VQNTLQDKENTPVGGILLISQQFLTFWNVTLYLILTAFFKGSYRSTRAKCCKISEDRCLPHCYTFHGSHWSILVSGYGQTGPMSQRAGYDAVASAISGLMHITGPEVGALLRIFIISLYIPEIFSFSLILRIKLNFILERNQEK
jgi:hypothetical protein